MSRTKPIIAISAILALSSFVSAQTPPVTPTPASPSPATAPTPPPASTTTPTATATATYSLKAAMKPSDVTNYISQVDLQTPDGTPVNVIATVTQKVTAADANTFTLEQSQSNMHIEVNGQDQTTSIPSGTLTVVYGVNGLVQTMKSPDPTFGYEDAYREEVLDTFLAPDKPVQIGDEWSLALAAVKDKWLATQLHYKLIGTETVGGIACLKISATAKETTGDEPASTDGTVWVDASTFKLVKKVVKVTNYPVPGAPFPITGTASFTLSPSASGTTATPPAAAPATGTTAPTPHS